LTLTLQASDLEAEELEKQATAEEEKAKHKPSACGTSALPAPWILSPKCPDLASHKHTPSARGTVALGFLERNVRGNVREMFEEM
jgi:hypothetical protein